MKLLNMCSSDIGLFSVSLKLSQRDCLALYYGVAVDRGGAGEGCSLQLHLALAAVWAISQHSEASHLSTVTHHIAVAVAPAVARPLWWRRSRHRRCRRQGSLVQTLDQCTHRDAARLLFQVSFRQCLHQLNV